MRVLSSLLVDDIKVLVIVRGFLFSCFSHMSEFEPLDEFLGNYN